MNFPTNAQLEDFCEQPPDHDLPPLDRAGVSPRGELQRTWHRDGFVILHGILPDDLMEAYCRVREPLGPGGFGIGTPYLKCPELMELACYRPVTRVCEELIGEPMGLHLNLTGWVSTERKWHQDDYLNHDGMNAHYIAAWMALEDIHPDSGPFQCIPGSHRWPLFRRGKLMACLSDDEQNDPSWPRFTEDFVAGLFEEKREREGSEVFTWLGKRGDVLLWHGRLAHQGSKPNVPGTPRRGVINHYSALSRRVDMPNRGQLSNGSYYFLL